MADSPHHHSHSHSHGLTGGWVDWVGDPVLRLVVAGVVVAALATLVGVVALWPTGQGRDAAIANADEIGLVTQRLTATLQEVVDGPCSYSTPDNPQECRTFTFELLEGAGVGSMVTLPEINLEFDPRLPDLALGDQAVLGYEESTDFYFFADQDRRTPLLWLTGLFAVVVIALGRFRGALALLAMATTLLVLVGFVAPSVLDGNDPLLVAVIAAAAIAFVSLYLTHGFTPTTTVALAGTMSALGLTLALSWVFFELARFTGVATEEALILPAITEDLNLSGLLLGGAIIGALGALDDVTVTQVATVAELRHRSPRLPTTELFASGIRVGRDHIASTVNTLLLAYAGASMPLLLLFAISDQSLSMVANSELIAVEIVRTLCGSIGLVAAVPITTALAAAILRPEQDRSEPATEPRRQRAKTNPRWEDFAPQRTEL
ncbi:MAG: YibE/F family protein [Acidimicrobiales bacterium]|nr:YibE/F family protein [Acidimicrobiales bacterium]